MAKDYNHTPVEAPVVKLNNVPGYAVFSPSVNAKWLRLEMEPSKVHFAHWSNGLSKAHTSRSLALVEASKRLFPNNKHKCIQTLSGVYAHRVMLNKG